MAGWHVASALRTASCSGPGSCVALRVAANSGMVEIGPLCGSAYWWQPHLPARAARALVGASCPVPHLAAIAARRLLGDAPRRWQPPAVRPTPQRYGPRRWDSTVAVNRGVPVHMHPRDMEWLVSWLGERLDVGAWTWRAQLRSRCRLSQ
jgi:hypothetical protein